MNLPLKPKCVCFIFYSFILFVINNIVTILGAGGTSQAALRLSTRVADAYTVGCMIITLLMTNCNNHSIQITLLSWDTRQISVGQDHMMTSPLK